MNASGHAHAAKRLSPPLGRSLSASDERQTVRRFGSVTYHALNVFLNVYAKSIHFTLVYPFLSLLEPYCRSPEATKLRMSPISPVQICVA